MKPHPFPLAPSLVVLGLALLSLSMSCMEPPHADLLLHADPGQTPLPDPQPEYHPE